MHTKKPSSNNTSGSQEQHTLVKAQAKNNNHTQTKLTQRNLYTKATPQHKRQRSSTGEQYSDPQRYTDITGYTQRTSALKHEQQNQTCKG
jgi:hypothetical protein